MNDRNDSRFMYNTLIRIKCDLGHKLAHDLLSRIPRYEVLSAELELYYVKKTEKT